MPQLPKTFIFGAGDYGKKALLQYNQQYEILGFLDNNKDLQGKKVMGINVFAPEYVKHNTFDLIIVALYKKNEAEEQLAELGVTKHDIISFEPSKSSNPLTLTNNVFDTMTNKEIELLTKYEVIYLNDLNKKYLEYGLGRSTIYVYKNFPCKIYGVDSSLDYVIKIKNECSNDERIFLYYADIGETKEWGYPNEIDLKKDYSIYYNKIFDINNCFDFILIDGRFRVNCAISCLLRNKSKKYIIAIHDYLSRDHYHILEKEKFIEKIDEIDNLAIFIPNNIEENIIRNFYENYKYDAR